MMTSTDLTTRAFNVLETEYAKTRQLIDLLDVEKKNLVAMNEKLKDENKKLGDENKSKDENAITLVRLNETLMNIERQLAGNFHKMELQIAIVSTTMSCIRAASVGTLVSTPAPPPPPAVVCMSCGHVHAPAPTAVVPAAVVPSAVVPAAVVVP